MGITIYPHYHPYSVSSVDRAFAKTQFYIVLTVLGGSNVYHEMIKRFSTARAITEKI